ncbi:MAG: hypothetical protein M1448_02580 [Candidatus Marsarchaeota archaeon]|jgi:hypothetical protein|nr:hypothetical protein [Candidatus Marsarchaeota archaeon]
MELNESHLIEREITLRKLRLPKEVLETRRSIVRWLALSLGIINPGESRQNAIPVFDAMLSFQFVQKKDPTVQEIKSYIDSIWEPINEKTLRYHLLQLKKINMLDNSKGKYFMVLPPNVEKYDESAWAQHYLNFEVGMIKEGIASAIKELGVR